ncbi:hypothetical protein IWZ01DRAFT_59854 [Phyllosticta capitalensis]
MPIRRLRGRTLLGFGILPSIHCRWLCQVNKHLIRMLGTGTEIVDFRRPCDHSTVALDAGMTDATSKARQAGHKGKPSDFYSLLSSSLSFLFLPFHVSLVHSFFAIDDAI